MRALGIGTPSSLCVCSIASTCEIHRPHCRCTCLSPGSCLSALPATDPHQHTNNLVTTRAYSLYANVNVICLFFLFFWRTSVLFVGPLIQLFWSSGDIFRGFRSQDGSLACILPCLDAMDSSHFTSGATPADPLFTTGSIATEPFLSMYLYMYNYWWDSNPRSNVQHSRW